jgi:hypothetical protein
MGTTFPGRGPKGGFTLRDELHLPFDDDYQERKWSHGSRFSASRQGIARFGFRESPTSMGRGDPSWTRPLAAPEERGLAGRKFATSKHSRAADLGRLVGVGVGYDASVSFTIQASAAAVVPKPKVPPFDPNGRTNQSS